MIISPDDTQIYELNTGMLKVIIFGFNLNMLERSLLFTRVNSICIS